MPKGDRAGDFRQGAEVPPFFRGADALIMYRPGGAVVPEPCQDLAVVDRSGRAAGAGLPAPEAIAVG
jgi:hypothetical protein